jgi:cardiolipin hydrolase
MLPCATCHLAVVSCRLLQFLGSSRTSLDVCVFTITCDEIAGALLEAHKRGVRVRIISDNDQVCLMRC